MKTGNKIGDTIIVAMISPNISVYVFISLYKTFSHKNFPVFLQLKFGSLEFPMWPEFRELTFTCSVISSRWTRQFNAL